MNNESRCCKACGTENPSSFFFCDQCGTGFEELESCSACGMQQRPGAKFCGNCGLAFLPQQTPSHEFANHVGQQANDDPSSSTISFLRNALRHYIQLWFDSDFAQACEIHPNDTAFHVFQYTGLLRRMTQNPQLLEGLLQWDLSELQELLKAACQYMKGQTLSQSALAILQSDALDPEDLERLDDLLIARDGVQLALDVAREIYLNLPEDSQDSFISPLASATANVSEFDDLLFARPDVLAVLGGPLTAMREEFAEGAEAWWFHKPAELASMFAAWEMHDLTPEPKSDSFQKAVCNAIAASEPVKIPTPVLSPLTAATGLPLPATANSNVVYSLQAATSSSSSSIFLQCMERLEFGGRLDSFPEGKHRFHALDQNYQVTSVLDGMTLLAKDGEQESIALIKDGFAELTMVGALAWFVCATDGVQWPLVRSM